MSNNTNIHVFTDETLAEHDFEIAVKVNQATTKHVARQMVRMTAPQQVRAQSRSGIKELMFDEHTLDAILAHIPR
ncbi:hypothetical protein [Citrobacter farmeri]|uniref:hypothetical protein n=1 Tax=Citrobacter farmeri TaxID=67824 RepID=UPI0021ABACA7|nr:hypothetical protein [Citrobacter farmeri]